MDNPHIGSNVDELLAREGILTEVDAAAQAYVNAWKAASRYLNLTFDQAAFDATHEQLGGSRERLEHVVRHFLLQPYVRPLLEETRVVWFSYARRAGLVTDTDQTSLETRLGRALQSEATDDPFFERRLAHATVALGSKELEYTDLLLKMIGY